jgi:hypothetical protein
MKSRKRLIFVVPCWRSSGRPVRSMQPTSEYTECRSVLWSAPSPRCGSPTPFAPALKSTPEIELQVTGKAPRESAAVVRIASRFRIDNRSGRRGMSVTLQLWWPVQNLRARIVLGRTLLGSTGQLGRYAGYRKYWKMKIGKADFSAGLCMEHAW